MSGGAFTEAMSCVKYCGTKRAVANMWEGKGLSSQNGTTYFQVKSVKSHEIISFRVDFSVLFGRVQKWLAAFCASRKPEDADDACQQASVPAKYLWIQ